MLLSRDNFKDVKNIVKNEIVCSIPVGTKNSKITEIDTDTFRDWEKLEYVYIPNSISIIHKNAFIWDNIKIIFADINMTKIEELPSHVKVLPILGNENTLFEILSEILEIKKTLEFDPKVIEKIDRDLRNKLENFASNSKESEEKLKLKQEELEKLLSKLDEYTDNSKRISENVLKKIQDYINQSIENSVNVSMEEMKQFYLSIKNELSNLDEVLKKCSDAKEILKSLEENLSSSINSYLTEIDNKIKNSAEEIASSYEDKKKEILDDVVREATKVLIEKNPCKNIIININDSKKKFESKDLFHKDFETILRLVATKKPILLKGPAGSGKNVIIEQVAKALDLEFYYLNDVTDEYKVMGFVDANGRYIDTQFYKVFTNGGLMFIDEIDNSNPSALLSINAAIGTGYNHYMAFPDGNFYKANENFYLVAAANTFGTGADQIYSGRQALDGASLNRFIPVTIDYDRELEKNLISHKEILNLYWNVREIVQANTMRHVISTRNIKNASDLLDTNSFDLGDIFDWTIIQGLDINDLHIIASRISGRDSYSVEFVKHLKRKYNVSSIR